jgi:hypothetical protein
VTSTAEAAVMLNMLTLASATAAARFQPVDRRVIANPP